MYEKKKVKKRNMLENLPLTFTRTIYDPASNDFVFDSGEKKALLNIKDWIKDHNPRIYWYILRIDNLSDSDISQWAVELYTHQALSITEAYIEDIDRRFQPRKSERDAWNEKYSLSITKQSGIPIVGKGLRRIFFKIDINCKQGLMNEYGISGKFMAQGIKDLDIKEKKFTYSCSKNEFKEIFNNNPDRASIYAEEKLRGRYSSYSVQIFTNTFRLIHELYGYCHLNTKNLDQDMLISKLQQLQASFETVPEIAGRRISPLIRYEIDQLTKFRNKSLSATSYLNLCNKIVEYLHIEVMGGDMKSTDEHSITQDHIPRAGQVNAYQKECPVCGNVITESNKSLICMKCRSRFCSTCEEWFREERKRGEKPLCEKCFGEEQKTKQEEEGVRIQREEEERKKSQEKPQTYTNSIGMKFTLIPAGEFVMGSEEFDWIKPVHRVKINSPFYLGIYPVTQREWKEVMGTNPSIFKGDNLPVEEVSWNDVQEFIKKLNQKEGTDKYRLPSEAEWEYAARAGTTTRYSFGDDESKLGDYAWYDDNSGSKTHEVGKKKPNPWGLYDIHGNVWEWVQDSWHDHYNGAPTDGSAWEGDGSGRVFRGGCWNCGARYLRSADRYCFVADDRYANLGFRLLRSL